MLAQPVAAWTRGRRLPHPAEQRRKWSTSTGHITSSKESDERATELGQSSLELYPRFLPSSSEEAKFAKIATFFKDDTQPEPESGSDSESLQLYDIPGRIVNIRKSSRNLSFLDLEMRGMVLQVMLSYQAVAAASAESVSEIDFQERCKILRRGDHVVVRGVSYRTETGHLSLKAVQLPTLTAPCLQRFPTTQANDASPPENSELDRPVEMLTYPGVQYTIRLRSYLVHTMRARFMEQGFTEVQTPILGGLAGGAAARPFETTATEFADRRVSLRIAPELWLKQLIVGGIERVFEIGPSFRNEGLDKTHNPEFTTCEFYATYWNLPRLMGWTEALLRHLNDRLTSRNFRPMIGYFSGPGRTKELPIIDFVPALNRCLGVDLPSLELSNQDAILDILKSKDIPIPATPSLPNLLDKLATHFLEPQCDKPTWIINIPECMSPLSKSFEHPTAPNKQRVAARAELFIHGKEVVNCYEEENSPFVQRQKFIDQQVYAANPAGQPVDEGKMASVDGMKIDEDYLRALEWGLPPTGGWGCGIDRLVMLYAGKERISDVLSFGNLRAVTRNAEKWPKSKKSDEQHPARLQDETTLDLS